MSFPIRLTDQLKPHLRALRKNRGLTQAQLGALVGVKQARIAEIEAKPGAVSLDQLTRVLGALGATLHLHSGDRGEPTASTEAFTSPPAAGSEMTPSTGGRKTAGKTTTTATTSPDDTSRQQGAAITFKPRKGSW